MQESFNISSSTGNYNVTVGSGLLNKIIADHETAIYMIDQRLEHLLPASITKRISIEANETNKSLERMPEIIQKMSAIGANRTSHLIAIGGGVIQDIATFTASVFMRGIEWTYLPTTMLGMADSCIGGKSSINNLGYKNLVGNFYPPKNVIIDTDFINSLNDEQIIGGLCEAAKICYARGYSYFQQYLTENPSSSMDSGNAQRVINKTLTTKKWFIETDEFDQNERLLLNFGHTFGHALEAGTNFGITHGIAVGIGMIIAAEYANEANMLTEQGKKAAEHLISHIKLLFGDDLLKIVPTPPTINLDAIIEKFNNDKKHKTDNYRMVIPVQNGQLELISEPKDLTVKNRIKSAYINGLSLINYPTDLIKHAE